MFRSHLNFFCLQGVLRLYNLFYTLYHCAINIFGLQRCLLTPEQPIRNFFVQQQYCALLLLLTGMACGYIIYNILELFHNIILSFKFVLYTIISLLKMRSSQVSVRSKSTGHATSCILLFSDHRMNQVMVSYSTAF